MKTCPACHQTFPDGTESCPRDGTPLAAEFRDERECPYCAERILKKARVCKHCGRDVEPVAGTGIAAQAPSPASPQGIAENPSPKPQGSEPFPMTKVVESPVRGQAEEERQAWERAEAKGRVAERATVPPLPPYVDIQTVDSYTSLEEYEFSKKHRQDNLSEIGGWLLWFTFICIGLTGMWLSHAASAVFAKSPLEVLIYGVIAMVSGWLAFSLATKRRELFTLLKVFFVIHFLVGLCVVLFANSDSNSIGNLQLVQAGRNSADGIFGVLFVALWWFYFKRSKRVKANYGTNLQLFAVPSSTSRGNNQGKDGQTRTNLPIKSVPVPVALAAPVGKAAPQRPSRAKYVLLGFAILTFVGAALNAVTSIISTKAAVWADQGLDLSLIQRYLIALANAWWTFSVPATLVMIMASLLIAVHLRQRQ